MTSKYNRDPNIDHTLYDTNIYLRILLNLVVDVTHNSDEEVEEDDLHEKHEDVKQQDRGPDVRGRGVVFKVKVTEQKGEDPHHSQANAELGAC